MIRLVPFDRTYLDRSWEWLRDLEIKQLTMAADFTRQQQLAFFQGLPGRQDYTIWGVAGPTGEPIGAAGIKNMAGLSGEVFLYIGEKDWWGKGAGVEILRQCERKARELGLKELRMQTSPDNARSARAFAKAGYVRSGCDDHAGTIHMTKKLST